jgi:hypothetical protein
VGVNTKYLKHIEFSKIGDDGADGDGDVGEDVADTIGTVDDLP